MKPQIRKCRGAAEGCHGRHSGPWMLVTERGYKSFAGYPTWREAMDACRRLYVVTW